LLRTICILAGAVGLPMAAYQFRSTTFLSGFKTCNACRRRAHKSTMHHDDAYGWFCNDAEFTKYWEDGPPGSF
jgi:hypothetical protein